jgi:hypothetical protein
MPGRARHPDHYSGGLPCFAALLVLEISPAEAKALGKEIRHRLLLFDFVDSPRQVASDWTPWTPT